MTDEGFVKQELQKYNLPNAKIAEMKKELLILKVKDSQDLDAYTLCKSKHQEVRQIRINIEKMRKELKAGSIEFGRAVEAEAKRLTVAISEIESHLWRQRRVVEDEQDRKHKEKEEAIRVEEERKKREEEERLETERKRLEEIEREQQEERNRIDVENKKIEAEKQRQKVKAARMEQEAKESEERKEREARETEERKQKEIEDEKQHKIDEKNKKDREEKEAKEREKQRLVDIEKAKKEEAARIERERLETEERKRKEEEEAKRLEALKPDFEKLKVLAQCIEAFEFPIVQSDVASKALNIARAAMIKIAKSLYSVVEKKKEE